MAAEDAEVFQKQVADCKSQHICRDCHCLWKNHTSWDGTVYTSELEAHITPIERPSGLQKLRKKSHSWRYRSGLGILAAIVLILVIALAVELRPNHPKGLVKGEAGLVALDRGDGSPFVDVFFAHETGQIRHVIWNDQDSTWQGGKLSENVLSPSAPAMRKGSPLMAASYMIGTERTWRVFYITEDDTLGETLASKDTKGLTDTYSLPTQWLPGSLGLGRYNASLSPTTGISVCQNMLWSSDPLGLQTGSLVLFYGDRDGTNHLLTHNVWETAWKANHTFVDSDAASGVECTCRGSSITDAWMMSKDHQLTQNSFESDVNSTSVWPLAASGNWSSSIVYTGDIANTTSISAIKYRGADNAYNNGSTFVHFTALNGIVNEINVGTDDRSKPPAPVPSSKVGTVNDVKINLQGGKIASVGLRTSGCGSTDGECGRDSYIFLETAQDPKQITSFSRTFDGSKDQFYVGDSSTIGR